MLPNKLEPNQNIYIYIYLISVCPWNYPTKCRSTSQPLQKFKKRKLLQNVASDIHSIALGATLRMPSHVNFSAPSNFIRHVPSDENAGALPKALQSDSKSFSIKTLIASRPATVRRIVAALISDVSNFLTFGALIFFFLNGLEAWTIPGFFFVLFDSLVTLGRPVSLAVMESFSFLDPRVMVGSTHHRCRPSTLLKTSADSGVNLIFTWPEPSAGWSPQAIQGHVKQ